MALATKWVETNKIDPKLDKDQEAYKDRVLRILAGAATDRAARGTRSAANAAKKKGLDPTTVAAAARIYYTKMQKVREKKILDRILFRAIMMYTEKSYQYDFQDLKNSEFYG